MSTHDHNSDAEQTAAWPGTQPPVPAPPPVVPQAAPPPGAPPGWPQQTTGQPSGGGWVPPTPPGTAFNAYGQPQMPPPPPTSGAKKGWLALVALVAVVAAAAAVIFLTPLSHKLFGGSDPGYKDTASPATTSTTSATTATSASSTTTAPSAGASAPNSAPAGTAAPGGGTVDPSDLRSYLAAPDELGPRFDGAVMEPKGLVKAPFTGIEVDPFKCTGAALPGMDTEYSGRGFTGFVGQVVNDAAGQHKLIQALATFPTADAAQDFVTDQVNKWRGCTYTDLTVTIDNKDDHTTTGVVAAHDDGHTFSLLLFPPQGSGGRQCERAISARNNIVVDVRACAPSVGSLGYTISRDIGQKITGQR